MSGSNPLHESNVVRLVAGARRDGGAREEEWEAFVLRYEDLIRRSVARVLRDPEEADEAFVRVLDKLRTESLGDVECKKSPRAWVAVVSSRVAIDQLRRRKGRVRWPEAIEELEALDRRVFELCHREGLDFAQTRDRLRAEGILLRVSELAAAFSRVEAALTPAARRSLDRQSGQRGFGWVDRSFQSLENVLEHVATTEASASPEFALLEREAAKLRASLRRAVGRLEPRDRELLHRYYHEDQAASEIDGAMDFGGVRRVHTALERIRRFLKRELSSSEIAGVVRDSPFGSDSPRGRG